MTSLKSLPSSKAVLTGSSSAVSVIISSPSSKGGGALVRVGSLSRLNSFDNLQALVLESTLHELALNNDLEGLKRKIGMHVDDKEGKRYIRYLDGKDKFGNTALMNAAWKGFLDIVSYLLASGAHINLQNNYGWTALIWATTNDHPRVVAFLLSKGADCRIPTPVDKTAVDFADNPEIRLMIREVLDSPVLA